MSAGGFIYEKVSFNLNSSDYATVNDWCIFVHSKRCEAFLRATERESSHWQSIQTNLSNESTVSIPCSDSSNVETYILQFHTNANYPAYVSYFKNPTTNSEYAIFTGAGFSFNPSSSTSAYLNPAKLNQLSGGGNIYFLANSFAHSMCLKGPFGDYSPASSSVATNELPITMQYKTGNSFQSNSDSSGYSVIKNYTGSGYNKKYTFGFAVKGDVIISIYHVDDGEPAWSVIGEIFTDDCVGGNPYGCLCLPHSVYGDVFNSLSSQSWGSYVNSQLSVIDSAGNFYPSKTIHDGNGGYLKSYFTPSYICGRPNATVPTKLAYGSLCCSFHPTTSNLNINGIDPDGNIMKGYINTDIIRVISPRLCATGGSLFQGGNFISMRADTAESNIIGILLGWDPSNGSI